MYQNIAKCQTLSYMDFLYEHWFNSIRKSTESQWVLDFGQTSNIKAPAGEKPVRSLNFFWRKRNAQLNVSYRNGTVPSGADRAAGREGDVPAGWCRGRRGVSDA